MLQTLYLLYQRMKKSVLDDIKTQLYAKEETERKKDLLMFLILN